LRCGGAGQLRVTTLGPSGPRARKIDLLFWIDATTGTCRHLTVADAKYRATALGLFGLPE
jgi:hypothetical protein